MVTENVEFTLKDGRKAILRNACEEDVQGMLDYIKITAGETDYIIRYPEECGIYTYEAEKKYIESCNANPYGAMLVCIVDGKLVGNCEIVWNNYIKTRHRASLAIAILKDYWNLGIGTAMFRELIRIGESNPEIMQMELDYIEGNNRARALYEKTGFRITGIKPDAVRLKDGTLLNIVSMVRKVQR